MKQVSRFEANLLRIVHGILGRAPLEKILPLATGGQARPPCLSRAAVEVLQDTLAKGTMVLLAREGWRQERFLRGNQVAGGRLWQRSSLQDLGLSFSRFTVGFLIWLTAWDREDTAILASPPPTELLPGDRLLFFLTYRTFRNTEVARALRQTEFITANGLCRLMFPDDFADPQPTSDPGWIFWTSGVGSCILETLQAALTKRWLDLEIQKRQLTSVPRMLALGKSQENTLRGFLEAVDSGGRRDLARFLLATFRVLLGEQATAQHWIGGLKTDNLRLSERIEACRGALALLRHLAKLQTWDAQARTVGYFDENYAASQLWKSDWEKYQGEDFCRRAELILREVEPLH